MIDQRIDVLDHQLQLRIDVVRETFAAQDARQDTLPVEDVFADQHRILLHVADLLEGFLVDMFAEVHVFAQRGDVFGQGFDQVGIEIDPHLEDRDQ